jgi:hypothetical protein
VPDSTARAEPPIASEGTTAAARESPLFVTSNCRVASSPTESDAGTLTVEERDAGVWTWICGHEVETASGAPVKASMPVPEQPRTRSPGAAAR